MKKLIGLTAVLSVLSACTTINPYTGQAQTSKAVVRWYLITMAQAHWLAV